MKTKIALLSFVLISFFSCQKEMSQDTIVTKPVVVEDSIYLSQYLALDTTLATRDTIYKIQFYYDTGKRNSGIDDIEYTGNIPARIFTSKFDYNGSDSFPSKKMVRTYLLPFLTIDSSGLNQDSYFFYKNGVLISDSSVDYGNSAGYQVVNRYLYYPDSMVVNFIEYNNGITVQNSTGTINLKKVNGNIVQQGAISALQTTNFTFLYDAHPNPFYRTESKFMIENNFPYYWMETWVEDIFAVNNALEINETSTDSFEPDYNFHFKNVYQYKANGYPSAIWCNDQNSPENSFKGIYFYTN